MKTFTQNQRFVRFHIKAPVCNWPKGFFATAVFGLAVSLSVAQLPSGHNGLGSTPAVPAPATTEAGFSTSIESGMGGSRVDPVNLLDGVMNGLDLPVLPGLNLPGGDMSEEAISDLSLTIVDQPIVIPNPIFIPNPIVIPNPNLPSDNMPEEIPCEELVGAACSNAVDIRSIVINRGSVPLSTEQQNELLQSVAGFDPDNITLKTLGGAQFSIPLAGGDIVVNFPAAAAEVQPLEPRTTLPTTFVGPDFLSVPLPIGSGARAFALGAFTAVADDASAASWNPAALTQLERAEISAVYRWSRSALDYRGGDDSLRPQDVRIESDGVNFLSAVVPFRVGNWPLVVSLNTLEAFDTRGRFSATTRDEQFEQFEDSRRDTFTATSFESRTYPDGENSEYRLDFFASAELEVTQRLRQEIQQSLIGTVDFEQRGVINALAPAIAIRPLPGFSLGASLKVFQDGGMGPPIRSRLNIHNTVETRSRVRLDTERVINGSLRTEGELRNTGIDPANPLIFPILPSVSELPEQRETQQEVSEIVRITETHIEETETLSKLKGMTPTIGALFDATPWLTLGASVEPGWTAKARQDRVRETNIVTRDPSGRVVSEQRERVAERENVEIDFPLRWSAGAAIRFSPDLLLSLDLGQRLYSDFTARGADGVERNPLNGKLRDEEPLEDTWRAAVGLEALVPFGRRFIPLRAGYQWEETPALGEPAQYHAVSVGTGWVGDRTVLDLSYQHRWGDDVLTQVPSREDISADAKQDFIACSLLFYF